MSGVSVLAGCGVASIFSAGAGAGAGATSRTGFLEPLALIAKSRSR
jgi:hypothetical protein